MIYYVIVYGSEGIKMPDYEEMYKVLFRSMTQAITILQEAQQYAEKIYISSDEVDAPLDTGKKEGGSGC